MGVADPDAGIGALLEVLGVDVDPGLLQQAVTHRSFSYENSGAPHNERLEFLGDAVLGLVVTEDLYRRFPDLSEGHLAKLRAAVVNARALADVARTLGLGACLRLGRGEVSTGGHDKGSILADAMEAVIGAVYLSAGESAARTVIERCFAGLIDASSQLGAGLDWKTSLQEAAATLGMGVPQYLIDESGPDHQKEFHARVRLVEDVLGEGWGGSKKVAEQQAAAQAFAAIEARLDTAES